MLKRYDCIVIGLGAMGAATLSQLSVTGKKILGIDQFSPLHEFGSSHGETRITRLAIGEGAYYTPFAIRSHELWRDVEAKTGATLLHSIGGLVIGAADVSTRFHNKPKFLSTTVEVARQFGIRHDVFSAREVRARYPQFAIGDSESAYFEYEAGYLKPEECVRSQLLLARMSGAHIRVMERVLSIERLSGGGVSVKTSHGEYFTEQVVVCAGPWISHLVPSLQKQCIATRQVLYWFSVEGAYERCAPERFPVFIWSFGDSEAEGIYGFPAIDGALGGMKIALSQYGPATDPSNVQREVSVEEKENTYSRYIARRLPVVNKRCIKATTCLYTVTPDSDFIIDRLPEAREIIVVSPCSGHGFKHSAAIGESVAQLVVKDKTTLDISSFALKRFL